MQDILNLLSQRRIWAGIVGVLTFALTIFNSTLQLDVPVLTDLLTAFGGALSALVTASLALWSYFSPKN